MKKALFALAFISTNITAPAQTIIPFVGGNMSAYTVKSTDYTSSVLPGFNVGGIADFRLSSRFSLQPGMQYCRTGGKVAISRLGPGYNYDFAYRVNALQLPVMLALKIGDEDRGHFIMGAGLYITMNLSGKLDVHEIVIGSGSFVNESNYREDLRIGSSEEDYVQRFDFGLNTGAGYHFANGLELYGFYQKGTVNILAGYLESGSRSYQAGLAVRYALKLLKQKTGPKKAGS